MAVAVAMARLPSCLLDAGLIAGLIPYSLHMCADDLTAHSDADGRFTFQEPCTWTSVKGLDPAYGEMECCIEHGTWHMAHGMCMRANRCVCMHGAYTACDVAENHAHMHALLGGTVVAYSYDHSRLCISITPT